MPDDTDAMEQFTLSRPHDDGVQSSRTARKRSRESVDGLLTERRPKDTKRPRRSGGHGGHVAQTGRAAAPDSIYGVVQGRRKKLWVRAIAWTAEQLQCLNVVFKGVEWRGERSAQAHGAENEGAKEAGDEDIGQEGKHGCRWHDAEWVGAIEQLSSCGLEVQKLAVREVLSRFGMVQAGEEESRQNGGGRVVKEDEVGLWIGGRVVDVMRTEGVFGKGWRRRCVAYINFQTIGRWREEYVRRRVHGGGVVGQSVWEGRKKALKLLEPGMAWEDPYVASVLIGLAQGQAAARAKENERLGQVEEEGRGEMVYGIGLPGIRAKKVFVYRAWIPGVVLGRLGRPFIGKSGEEQVVVEYETVRLNPTRPDWVRESGRRVWCSVGQISEEING